MYSCSIVDCTSSNFAIRFDSWYMSQGLVNENNNNRLGLGDTIDRLNDHYRYLEPSCIMSSFLEFIRKMGHRLCSRELPDKFLFPQMALGRDSGDVRVFKRMVLKGRLAPFYPGFEDSDAAPGLEECPICYMHYRVMNKTKCCRQRICSECIAQIQSSNGSSLSGCPCPFCKKSGIHLEVCLGKTELEKQAERQDEQQFADFCCRERGLSSRALEDDSQNTDSSGTSSGRDSRTPPPVPETPLETELEPVLTPTLQRRRQNGCPVQRSPLCGATGGERPSQGASSSSLGGGGGRDVFETPRTVQDEYRQEYEALSRASGRGQDSEFSQIEMQHCFEYLGVNPFDLGLHRDEFNDLMLEQVLISSMMEDRETQEEAMEQQQQEQETESSVSPQQVQSPSLRSHFLTQDELSEEDSVHDEDHHGTSSPVGALAQQLASSGFFSFSSQNQVESSSMDVPQTTEGSSSRQTQQDHDGASGSSDSFGTVWSSLLNSLAGIGDRNIQLQTTFLRFDNLMLETLAGQSTYYPTTNVLTRQHSNSTSFNETSQTDSAKSSGDAASK